MISHNLAYLKLHVKSNSSRVAQKYLNGVALIIAFPFYLLFCLADSWSQCDN
jgi:hypothetical protein